MAIQSLETVDARHLREKIVLLYKLNDTPEQPTDNSTEEYVESHNDLGNRVLSFGREKQVTETFAFLAAMTDDPRQVAALCVEEFQARKGLSLTLAANNGDLSLVKKGFENITWPLERTARHG